MINQNANVVLFALVAVAIPALIHTVWQGSYQPEGLGTFWIGPVSTTIPFVCLSVLFLAHCYDLEPTRRRSAYCGAGLAWICMMALTVLLIFQPPGPKVSSTMGIAVGLTPIIYLPLLAVPYLLGALIGKLWTKREEKKEREAPSVFR